MAGPRGGSKWLVVDIRLLCSARTAATSLRGSAASSKAVSVTIFPCDQQHCGRFFLSFFFVWRLVSDAESVDEYAIVDGQLHDAQRRQQPKGKALSVGRMHGAIPASEQARSELPVEEGDGDVPFGSRECQALSRVGSRCKCLFGR